MRWEITKKPYHHSHRQTLDWTRWDAGVRQTKTGCWSRALGWRLLSDQRVTWERRACESRSQRAESGSSENEALLHNDRNIFMLFAIFNFKPVCNYPEPDVPRLNSGWNLIVTDPAWARGPLCHGRRWSERSVVTIWKCYPDQSCLASSRSGSLFREKERAVTAHLKLPLLHLAEKLLPLTSQYIFKVLL